MRTSSGRAGLTAVAAVLALTACGASEPVPVAEAVSGGENATDYPLVVENCGESVTIEAAPQRVVSLDQGSTEILLALGLGDRLVGTASWTDPVLPELEEANASVPRLADNAPSYEVLLGADPDFVTASFGRHFREGGVVQRPRLAESGIDSYLSPTDCEGPLVINGGGTRTTPLEIDSLYQEIRELAEVFDVSARGEELVAELQQRADAATDRIEASDRTMAFWFADTKSPYVAGGLGSANLLATTVGAENVFADLDDDWPAVGWETVVERDPDVLVLGDLQRDRFPGDRLADKEEFLATDPLTSTMGAVQDEAYIALHGAEMNPSIRFVDALEKLADGLDQIEQAP
ncbi:ABC transporter substrate-binding protein [Modestobacter marinus]|uniref:ABC transporter substrate-binding protein n=1 Tax=Modestobacter marinus TaxID=477641 RepID=A0A846LKY5_9ACTN|nr:ABC transporter substrate-binding protein [Modestobacter marinus]NIH65985.1 iron complex transport system substrate-binding protein [Modestobacter marinus]GGL68721.1 ABC transporter substrate-binding protein [Modestobacter marinus]